MSLDISRVVGCPCLQTTSDERRTNLSVFSTFPCWDESSLWWVIFTVFHTTSAWCIVYAPIHVRGIRASIRVFGGETATLIFSNDEVGSRRFGYVEVGARWIAHHNRL